LNNKLHKFLTKEYVTFCNRQDRPKIQYFTVQSILRSEGWTSYLLKLCTDSHELSHIQQSFYGPSMVVVHFGTLHIVKTRTIFVAIHLKVEIMRVSFIYWLCSFCICCPGYIYGQN